MDMYTEKHLAAWLENTVHEDEREETERLIRELVEYDHSLIVNHSWPEIRQMAERNKQFGIGR